MRATSLALALLVTADRLGVVSARLSGAADADDESPAAVDETAAARSLQYDEEEPPLEIELPGQSSASDSLIAMQFTDDPYGNRDKIEMIKSGELGLAGIRFGARSFDATDDASDGYYTEVSGEFCVFDATLNNSDPAAYPTIGAVMGESDHCSEHAYTMDLRGVMQAIAEHDSSGNSPQMKYLPLSGMVLHEGYVGAALVSNALSTFDSAHVISEHAAIRDALGACDTIRNRYRSVDCSPAMHQQLVQDVFKLLSRAPATSLEQHLYLKLSAGSTAYLPELTKLYPETPWAFVYREADHALAKASQRARSGPCFKARRNPSMALSAKSFEHSLDLESMSNHEICALYLSTLLDTAVHEHAQSGTGMLISYDTVIKNHSNEIVNVVLPFLGLQEEIDLDPQGALARVSNILSTKSNANGGGEGGDRQWHGESIEVKDEVGNASRLFMDDSMNSLAATSTS